MRLSINFLFPLLVLSVWSSVASAGTLDDAPFKFVTTNSDWVIDDAKAQPMGKGVFLVATLSNTVTTVKSVVIKTELETAQTNALEEVSAGMRDSLGDPAAKGVFISDTTFLGYKAKTLTCENRIGPFVTYNHVTFFVE